MMRTVFFGIALLCLPLAASGAAAAEPKRPEAPSITPSGGEYDLNARVRVSIRGQPGTRIIYTLDGENPDQGRGIRAESNTIFFDLPPASEVTVKAVAIRPGFATSHVRRAHFVRRDMRQRPPPR